MVSHLTTKSQISSQNYHYKTHNKGESKVFQVDQNLGFTTGNIKLYYVFKTASNEQIISILVIAGWPNLNFLVKKALVLWISFINSILTVNFRCCMFVHVPCSSLKYNYYKNMILERGATNYLVLIYNLIFCWFL